MKLFIILFGVFVLVMAAVLVFRPKVLNEFLIRHAGKPWMQIGAAVMRIAIGIALILYAGQTRFTLALQILGWVALTAGIIVALIPPARFKRLVEWAFERFGAYTRVAAIAAVLFGGFLIYAVI